MIRLVIGRREQGKTTLAYWSASRVSRRLIFDPRGTISFGTTVRTPAALTAGFAELLDGDRAELVYTPDEDEEAGFARFAHYVRQWVRRHPSRPIAVVVDEAGFVKEQTDKKDFRWVLRCCRREATHIWLTAHRPQDITTNVRSIADHWMIFACRQEHDLKDIGERCGPRVVAAVRSLRLHEFVHWDDTDSTFQVYREPEDWGMKLSGAPAPRPIVAAMERLDGMPYVEGVGNPTLTRLF